MKSYFVTSSARVSNGREKQALNICKKPIQHLRNGSYFGVQQTSRVAKWTVILPADLARFVERYQQTHALESRSEVITQSLRALQEAELAQAYRNHAAECKSDPEREFWDSAAITDGLEEG